MSDIDQDMLNDFLDESNDLLETIEEDFLALENQDNDNSELINQLFRAVHTIKGTSGFLGFNNIGQVSHAMETLLSYFRENKVTSNKVYIDALLKGADMLKILIEDITKSEEINIDKVYSTLVNLNNDIEKGIIITESNIINNNANDEKEKIIEEEATSYIAPSDKNTQSHTNELDKELVKDFIFEANKYLENFEIFLLNAKKNIKKVSIKKLSQIFNSLKAISGTSAYIGLNKIHELSSLIALQLERIQTTKKLNTKILDRLLEAKDKLQILVDDAFHSNEEDISEILNLFKIKKPKKIEKNTTSTPFNIDKKIELKTEIGKNEKIKKITHSLITAKKESLRVTVDIIDRLMRLAGELVLIRNQEIQLLEKEKIGNREVIQRLDTVTSEIQETIMQTRLQPLSNIFSKFTRVVRDLGDSLNKKVELITTGAEVELDKTILEELAAPMTHLIRNSVDHGIETPEERIKAGKPEVGTLTLSAVHEGGIIVITIKDDGAGINIDKVKTKALSKGLATPDTIQNLSKNEILNFIFMPGFSTNEEVSSVSGRGVGMDVVRTSVEKLSGSIEIDSISGEGTSIILKLPLTLAILPSLVIASLGHIYAIPQVNLEILVSIAPEDIEKTIEKAGTEEIYRLQDTLIPLIRLNEVFHRKNKFSINDKYEIIKKYSGLDKEKKEQQESLKIAILSTGNRKYGLIVDNVVGAEEIVVNQMHSAVSNLKIYSGTAIMGDGSVALILDTQGIANHANVEFNANQKDILFNRIDNRKESVLLFINNKTAEQFAISLPLIHRIIEIEKHMIESLGSKDFVNIDNRTIRILRLNEILDVSKNQNKEIEFLILFKHIEKPIGLLVSSLKDIVDVSLDIGKSGYTQEGLLGSDIIDGKITLFLDIYALVKMAEPEWFKEKTILDKALNKADKKIMITDDSSIFRQMISKYLTDEGYQIQVANDGKEALDFLEKEDFDLLVSDIEMPIMNGYELIHELRRGQKNQNIPAIALSSLNTEVAIQKALSEGFNEYEIKLEKRHFLEKVENILFK